MSTEKIYTITTRDNLKLSGTLAQLDDVLAKLGDKLSNYIKFDNHYWSESKGAWVALSEMNDVYLINALFKALHGVLDSLQTDYKNRKLTIVQVAHELVNFPPIRFTEVHKLVKELFSRNGMRDTSPF